MVVRLFSSTLQRSLIHNTPRKRTWSSITPTQTGVTVHALNNTVFPYLWLRDSCQSSPECIHPSTKQKLHRTSDIAFDVKPVSFGSEGIKLIEGGLEIVWTDGHRSTFSRAFLERYSDGKRLQQFHKDIKEVIWDNTSIQKSDFFITYEEVKTSKGLVRSMAQLASYGLVFVTGVSHVETSNEACELRKLGELFGELRPTFYGLLWDVMNVQNSKNIAYTNLDLGLHMDLLYFQHPPRYQILHCLRNRVVGGTSTFVDGFAVAETLRKEHPAYFKTLTTSPVAFHYINDGHHLHYEHPTIELIAPSHNTSALPVEKRPIGHINYSPPFQAPLPIDTPSLFYPALRRFSELLDEPGSTYQYTLREGDAVLFDNRRVLHARTRFHERGDVREGETSRWLKGCYLEADAIMDRMRVLKTRLEEKLI